MATAKEDILIEREDLGPEAYTLVVKGDPIPPHLADLPRRPREPKQDEPKSEGK